MSLFIFLSCAYLTIISSIDATVEHDFYWRDYTFGGIPCDAYQGAPGLYIGQVNTKELNIVANIYSSNGNAITTYGNDVLTVEDDIKILSTRDQSKFYWEYVDFDKPQDQQLQDAIRGGYHNNTRDPLFIGKVMHQGEWKIGKVHTFKHKDKKGIWVWNQREQPVNIHQFHLLKYNVTVPAGASAFDFFWRDYVPGHLPADALEGSPGLYIGQFVHHGNCPAVIYPNSNVAVAELFGKTTVTNNIKILCTSKPEGFYWESVNFNNPSLKQMEGAVKGGFYDKSMVDLYIGKVQDGGEWKIGRVMPIDSNIGGLWLWDNADNTIRKMEFQILKYKPSNSVCIAPVHAQE